MFIFAVLNYVDKAEDNKYDPTLKCGGIIVGKHMYWGNLDDEKGEINYDLLMSKE
jgi:hypothetical protein